MTTVFCCEETIDGILTGIYEAWMSGLEQDAVKVQTNQTRNLELFSCYVQVQTDPKKAEKIAETLRRSLPRESWRQIFLAALSENPDRGEAIYRVFVMVLAEQGGQNVMERLQNPDVCRVFELSRRVEHESHRYLGFLRFRETENRILYSRIHPENRVLAAIGEHFANRFPQEHFLIYDETHGEVLIHPKGRDWFLAKSGKEGITEPEKGSGREAEFQDLWQTFCSTIAIDERRNPGLQKQMLPLKFRGFMTERYE